MMRCVTSRFPKPLRRLAAAALIPLCLVAPAGAEPSASPGGSAQPVTLHPDQVRALAVDALKTGDHAQAIALARGLLQADIEDPVAYFVLASAHGELGDATLSRKAAQYAYRYSEDGPDRFQAGQMAARAAVQEDRFSLAQYWLRLSAIHADTPAQKDRLAEDYRILRQLNPWSARIELNVRPSNNVNNGSEDSLQIIEGVPVTGVLSGAAQALSGVITTLDMSARYRLRADAASATYLGGRLYTKRVALSTTRAVVISCIVILIVDYVLTSFLL